MPPTSGTGDGATRTTKATTTTTTTKARRTTAAASTSASSSSFYASMLLLVVTALLMATTTTTTTTTTNTTLFVGASATAATTASSAATTASSPSAAALSDAWLPPLPEALVEGTEYKDVVSCCRPVEPTCADTGGGRERVCAVASDDDTTASTAIKYETTTIGRVPQFSERQSLYVLERARKAWDGGSGPWPTMSLKNRVDAVLAMLEELRATKRELIVETLMMEIGKNRPDAESEFDRTLDFASHLLNALLEDPQFNAGGKWQTVYGGTAAFVRRAPIGVWLGLAPYNYPLNESYAMILPALLMGNVVILKIPTVGGLCHFHTFDAVRRHLPEGVFNFVSGSGRSTMPPLMSTGQIDGLAFIGGTSYRARISSYTWI